MLPWRATMGSMSFMQSVSQLPSTEIVIAAGARTPFGAFMGSFLDLSATDLGVIASKAAIKQSGFSPEEIDQTIFGNVIQTSSDAAYLARHVGLKSGLRIKTTALTLNRLCGSGFQSVLTAAEQILLGQANVVLAGGSENMSQSPYLLQRFRQGYRLGNNVAVDSLQSGLTDSYNGLPMGITAENLAKKYTITRKQSDEFSLQSQIKTKEAFEKGVFDDEVSPVTIQQKKKEMIIRQDEHPRFDTSIEMLTKLKPVFDKNGIVTAGSSSGIVDGAASLIVTTKHEVIRRGLPYLGKIISHGIAGCEPDIMGIGPVPAVRKALVSCGKTVRDMDIVEVNEAFAPQVLSVVKELGIDQKKLNVNGGAIAVGHPLAATGTRMILTALLELKRRNKRYALVTACIGGGQGIALVLENDQVS